MLEQELLFISKEAELDTVLLLSKFVNFMYIA